MRLAERRAVAVVLVAALVVAALFAARAGARSEGIAPNPPKFKLLPDKRPPGWVAIESVANGCGPGKASAEPSPADASQFSNLDSLNPIDRAFEAVEVNFRAACELHDAGYSGALVWDKINGQFIDFRDAKWTRAAVDQKFKEDMEKLCVEQVPADAPLALERCKTGGVRYRVVRAAGWVAYRPRLDLSGSWSNTADGWPLCDTAVGSWTVKQSGRTVVADWQHGTAGSYGHFEGVYVTGDQAGDDRVVGTYTITESKGGPKVSGGTMTWNVAASGERLDFNGSLPAGTLLLTERATQALHSVRALPKCAKPKPATTTPAAAHGDYITITDGTATAGIFTSGAKAGSKTCAGGVTLSSYQQDCTDNQSVGTTLTLTARINGPLPSGAQLWLWYDPPNASDPAWQRCDPSIKSNCVLAKTTSGTSLTATVALPADKSFGGGAHGAEAAVEIVSAQGYVQGGLGIQLCQDGTTPRCG
jgi:hypothetical protein